MSKRKPVRHLALVLASLVCLGAVTLPALPEPASAVGAPPQAPRPIVTGWMPYWSAGTSLKTVLDNADLYSEVSPFWFNLTATPATASGITIMAHPMSSGTHASNLAALHAKKIRVIPTVTDGTEKRYLAGVLADPKKRTALVVSLADLANKEALDGIDLDWETFAFTDGSSTWASTHISWLALVKELSVSLAKTKKTLTVDIPPMESPTRGYWVYDYKGIAPYVSRVRIMTYDYSFDSPGPIGPLDWTSKEIAYAVTQIPSTKIQVGIPAYGRAWVTGVTGTCPTGTSLAKKEASSDFWGNYAATNNLPTTWNNTYAERTFTYTKTYSSPGTPVPPNPAPTATCTLTRTVWFPDAQSIRQRAALVETYKLGGIAMWSLDNAPSGSLSSLRTYASTIAVKPTATTLSSPRRVPSNKPLIVSISVTSSKNPVSSEPVSLFYRASSKRAWTRVARGTTDARGKATLSVAKSRQGQYFAVASTTWGYSSSASSVHTVTLTAPVPTGIPAVSGATRSVLDYGAKGDGVTDDTAAIQTALNAMRAGDTLVFPTGRTFVHTAVLDAKISGTTITGGGTLLATKEATSAFHLAGNNMTLSGLTFKMGTTTKRWDAYEQMKVRVGSGIFGITISDITIDGSAAAGLYLGNVSDFILNNVTVENTRADAIHMTGGTHNGVVYRPLVVNPGDDGVAVVSYKNDGVICHDIKVVSPQLVGQQWGRAFSVVGGNNITETDVYSDSSSGAAIYLAAEGEYNTYGDTNIIFDGGTLLNSNTDSTVDHGAIMIYSSQGADTPNDTITVRNISISGTRATASRQVGVIQYGAAIQSKVTLANIAITGGNKYLFGGNAPASVARRTGWAWNGNPVPDVLGW